MRSNKYEPRACEICGRMYKPSRADQRTCASEECVKERKRLYYKSRKESGMYQAHKRLNIHKYEPEPYVPKPDTIVAIGYAERQMQQSLEMAGKVKVEL